jgi:hypothetical protein
VERAASRRIVEAANGATGYTHRFDGEARERLERLAVEPEHARPKPRSTTSFAVRPMNRTLALSAFTLKASSRRLFGNRLFLEAGV